MKLYNEISKERFCYDKAFHLMTKGAIITRDEWSGFHFLFMGNYIIYTKDREIIINPEEIYDKDKEDWMAVLPTQEAFEDSYKKLQAIFELSKVFSI
jgi:hypothetical protein